MVCRVCIAAILDTEMFVMTRISIVLLKSGKAVLTTLTGEVHETQTDRKTGRQTDRTDR